MYELKNPCVDESPNNGKAQSNKTLRADGYATGTLLMLLVLRRGGGGGRHLSSPLDGGGRGSTALELTLDSRVWSRIGSYTRRLHFHVRRR
jgi:hypothetical protein